MKANINNVKLTIENVEHEFINGTYNGISVIKDKSSGFVNATSFCNQFDKKFRKIYENHSWQEYIKAFENEYYLSEQSTSRNSDMWSFKLNKDIPDKFKQYRGTYIDSRLINYIAIWCSPAYAISVGKIMDSINEQVHEQLTEKQLEDTPANAKPVFDSIIEEYNKQCKDYWRNKTRSVENMTGNQTPFIRDKFEREPMDLSFESYSNYIKQYLKDNPYALICNPQLKENLLKLQLITC